MLVKLGMKTSPTKRKSSKKPVEEEVEEAVVTEKVVEKRPAKKSKKSRNNKKRRLAIDNVITPLVQKIEANYDDDEPSSFRDFELDELLLQKVHKLGWEKPTQVQQAAIPLALENKNLMVRARTGSGKTAAFVLPILQRIIQSFTTENGAKGPYALFIAPTKELSSQIASLVSTFIEAFPYLQCIHLTEINENERAVWEEDHPELVVTTPGKLKTMLDIRSDYCSRVRHVVLDEADLLLSFGYEPEMKFIQGNLPSTYQCILTSATLSDDISPLKALYMTGPVLTIKLKESDLPSPSQLTQYYLEVDSDEERFAILIAMLKLKLIVGKTIVFVKNPDRCYQMNLFLHAFKLKSGILNSAMPANSRCLVINQFNEGLFPIIIASDAGHLYGSDDSEPKPKTRKMDKEAGVARGIDFHHVSNVVNFDIPNTIEGYIHRVGRTARGWNKGTALTFCTTRESPQFESIQKEMNEMMGCTAIIPYEIRKAEIDSFLLRTRDALASCTKGVIKEARLAEIREEALRSAKLKTYFAANPRERNVIATDKQLHTLKVTCPALGDVPDYIVPKALRGIDYNPTKKPSKKKRGYTSQAKKNALRDSKDPLKTFSI